MTPNPRDAFLRRVLLLDAATSGLSAIALLAGAEALAPILGLPKSLLLGAGAVVVPFTALVLWVATREALPRAGAWIVIGLNVLWAADSVLLLFTDWVSPAALGTAFVLAQAAAVAVLAELEFVGLKRMAA